MASYPPPPPAPQIPVSRADWKNQRRAAKAQVRFQRDQVRAQVRSMRRRSIVGPLFLVALGVVFLLVKLGRLSWLSAVEGYGRWWPLLLILAGLILLAEWTFDQAAQKQRVADGLPAVAPRRLGGGVIWLLVLFALIGEGASHTHLALGDMRWPFGDFDFVRAIGDPHDSDDSMTETIAADTSLTIDNSHGDVTISGTSNDGQMHIAVHKQVYALNDSDAVSKAQRVQPVVEKDSGRVTVRVPYVENGQADLTIEVPRTVTLTVTADHGEVRVSNIHAPVVVNGNRGSVDLSDLEGDVVAHMHSDSATLSAHSINGSVTVDGRTGDANVSDVHGVVSLGGNFSGATHLERINGAVRFHTHRTDFQMARLDGEVQFDTGDELHADQLMGPVVLKTSDRNITLERVQGNLEVANRNGSVTVTSASPLGTIEISNRRGSVDVGVPEGSGFVVHASTRHGDVENDFALAKSGSDTQPQLNGTVGRGGPTIHLETSDGDLTVRKSTVLPLPPVPPIPPVAPKITAITSPTPPVPPAPPVEAGKKAKAPKAPKPYAGSSAPASTAAPAAPVKPGM